MAPVTLPDQLFLALSVLPGTQGEHAALIGVQPATLSWWRARHEGRLPPPQPGRAGRARHGPIRPEHVNRAIDALRAHAVCVAEAIRQTSDITTVASVVSDVLGEPWVASNGTLRRPPVVAQDGDDCASPAYPVAYEGDGGWLARATEGGPLMWGPTATRAIQTAREVAELWKHERPGRMARARQGNAH